jgi:NAD(P)-dependent dehydrogenase (short-subunit alcohol dehydrogenase family)
MSRNQAEDYFDESDGSPPAQEQDKQPGHREDMHPEPLSIRKEYRGSGKLKGKVALITGGDSGIGRSVALHFAHEGADMALVYLDEVEDAEDTRRLVEGIGRECLLIQGDLSEHQFCLDCIEQTTGHFGGLNIQVNNAAQQFPSDEPEEISPGQLEQTFETNFYSFFYLAQAALEHMDKGDCIINTTSVTAFRGSGHLLDYSASKGAIVAFTRSLAKAVADRGIRVNAVAPGPIWTPLIPATFEADHVAEFGKDTLLGRAGQPSEVGPSYVFLASEDASYFTGQILHPNGGDTFE